MGIIGGQGKTIWVEKPKKTCPKCGGTSGFTFYLTLKTKRRSDWEEDNQEEIGAEVIRQSAFGECQDCGQKIKIPVDKP